MARTNYNDTFLISKVLLVIQERHPEYGVGNYRKHSPSADGRGLRVRLTNGIILVTYDALAHVYDADEIKDFTASMIQSFVPDKKETTLEEHRSKSRVQKLLQFFGRKELKMKN
jgi:hypothetical protein